MKICLPSLEGDIESKIDPRFGRCNYFILAEIKGGKIIDFSSVENLEAKRSGGAGMAAAEKVGQLGADIVIVYDIGPKSEAVLNQMGIKIIKSSGTVKEALEKYIKDNS